MALGDPYAALADLKARLDIDVADETHDDELTDKLDGATLEVNHFCNRQFNDAGTASARVYRVGDCGSVDVDDFSTDTGLVVKTDDGGTGTFSTTWDASDYELEPLNGIVDGETGWPYWTIRAVGGRRFPTYTRRASLQVTAQWGWGAVPAAVKDAALILAAESFKLREAPFGVAGFGDFGVVRVRDLPTVARKLAPYDRTPIMVG